MGLIKKPRIQVHMGQGGYAGESLGMLEKYGVRVGERVTIHAGGRTTGILMPRYEGSDDLHVTLKLDNGYNIGIETRKITEISGEGTYSGNTTVEYEAPARNPDLREILLLSTGGTIASRIDYRTGAVTPALTSKELYAAVPELAKVANVRAETVLSEYSENLQPEDWKKIAERLHEAADSGVSGIMVAHGTDTMQYTAAFLSFALAGYPLPVAMVGSQRSSDRPSSDAAANLLGAARFVLDSGARGIYVVMHHGSSDDTIACHAATRTRKNHTSARSAFETIGDRPAFLIKDGTITRNSKVQDIPEYRPALNIEPRVSLTKYHPGLDPGLIRTMTDSGYRAIILEGTGLGHVGRTLYNEIKRAIDSGVFVGMTSQCLRGSVRMTVYESGRDLARLGVVPLGNMLPETALAKAIWAFGNHPRDEAARLMTVNLASEMTGRNV